MDSRFKKLNELLIEYSLGNYDARIKVSTLKDEVDAFITGVNMLGEELKSTAISRNYFTDIFDSVADKVFVLNKKGIIVNANKSVSENLEIPNNKILKESIDNFFTGLDKKSIFNKLKKQLHSKKNSRPNAPILGLITSKPGNIVSCSMSFLTNSKGTRIGYILTIRDVTEIRSYEERLIASEEKYRDVFQKSSDAFFIMDENGYFMEVNKAGLELLKLKAAQVPQHKFIDFFYAGTDKKLFFNKLEATNAIVNFKTKLSDSNGEILDCLISMNRLHDSKKQFKGYQGVIKNITKQEQIDNLIIRTIIDTQEKERIRFSKDIHDSLGQQLSAIKFYIGALGNMYNLPPERKNSIVEKSNDAIMEVLTELRNICFNLMPKTLQSVGLKEAVNELCRKMTISGELNFKIDIQDSLSGINKNLEFAIFRIIQEFINNSIKHGKPDKISISINMDKKKLIVFLKDNGLGFNMELAERKEGMGLMNVRSRVKSYNGTIDITSAPKKGTSYLISIPV